MSSEPVEEYADEQTGVRVTVERDGPYQQYPRITVFPPEGAAFTFEEVKAAIYRLLRMAGIAKEGSNGEV